MVLNMHTQAIACRFNYTRMPFDVSKNNLTDTIRTGSTKLYSQSQKSKSKS